MTNGYYRVKRGSMRCKYCTKLLHSTWLSTRVYCSDACRQSYYRLRKKGLKK